MTFYVTLKAMNSLILITLIHTGQPGILMMNRHRIIYCTLVGKRNGKRKFQWLLISFLAVTTSIYFSEKYLHPSYASLHKYIIAQLLCGIFSWLMQFFVKYVVNVVKATTIQKKVKTYIRICISRFVYIQRKTIFIIVTLLSSFEPIHFIICHITSYAVTSILIGLGSTISP